MILALAQAARQRQQQQQQQKKQMLQRQRAANPEIELALKGQGLRQGWGRAQTALALHLGQETTDFAALRCRTQHWHFR